MFTDIVGSTKLKQVLEAWERQEKADAEHLERLRRERTASPKR